MTPVPPAGRLGPRPLALHLMIQGLTWMSSRDALPSWRSGSLAWNPSLADEAKALAAEIRNVDPAAFETAVDAEAGKRMLALAQGVEAYRNHPARRVLDEPPTICRQGSTRVLDYGVTSPRGAGGTKGVPLLVVPSLINRAYILDLAPERSLMRHLAGAGVRPFLVDWGAPEGEERGFDLTDYVGKRLVEILDAVAKTAGGPVHVLGYCMGGPFVVALAQHRPKSVASLVLLAAPWDFSAYDPEKARLIQACTATIERVIQMFGVLPVDMLQAMFASLDPYMTSRKFRRFGELDATSANARMFVALEDWLNDGVALSGPVASEAVVGWFVDNTPGRNTWRILDRPVIPAEVNAPALVYIPEQDYIVPPDSALALARALPRAETRMIAAGHIGMVAGSQARALLYEPLAAWLHEQPR